MEDLKPCPFCGNSWPAIGQEREYSTFGTIYVYCTNCRASGPSMPSKKEAIEAWNRRADDGLRKQYAQ